MKGIFKTVLEFLFGQKQILSSSKYFSDDERRCLRILNYWLDSELFDLPECPMDIKKQIVSEPADKFLESWEKLNLNDVKLSDKSRLLIMFQCHRAGYIATSEEKHPNFIIPRTYLCAIALIPKWNNASQEVEWLLSDDKQDSIINLATIRTLYRKCPASIPNNMSLSQWVEARIVSIESLVHSELKVENDSERLNTKELCEKIKIINRELANEFWPDDNAKRFMLNNCQPIDSGFQDSQYDAAIKINETLTFRWRYCFYPNGLENLQLGPFFVKDLENSIKIINKYGIKKISKPLKKYLIGHSNQIEIPKAVNHGDQFYNLTNLRIYGRWPENIEYGLSLLQYISVNVANKMKENPIVAVNGPPGTGKTTLLKDIIANNFVLRTYNLSKIKRDHKWLENSMTPIMNHSMIVTSSNNKAVENISKELPALSKLPKNFRHQVKHFKCLASKNEWGLFCAVLGNSSNRKEFKPKLKKIINYFKNIHDVFQLNYLINSLKKFGKSKAQEQIMEFVTKWENEEKILLLIKDIEICPCYEKYSIFFKPFVEKLSLISDQKLTVKDYANEWRNIEEEDWKNAIDSLDVFKRQWFGKKLYNNYFSKKLKATEKKFNDSFNLIYKLKGSNFNKWDLHVEEHLLNQNAYKQKTHEKLVEAENRLQLSSPFGSTKLNQARSMLFVNALKLNEALVESMATQLKLDSYWEKLNQLIDGRLETKENTPEHQILWSLLFLLFPVVSTSLSSVENQFKLMQKPEGFGLSMIDEAGQAVPYHVVGLLQRSKQAIFVGDPIQLEPVVKTHKSIDLAIAKDFIPISKKDGEHQWGDDFMISFNSAQSVADKASRYFAKIGTRKVGIPLFVHRRCSEPMFSISNKIAYDNNMVFASQPYNWSAIPSGWIHVFEHDSEIKSLGYKNTKEAKIAFELVKYLAENHPQMIKGGIYIITPFSLMRTELKTQWEKLAKLSRNHNWMGKALGDSQKNQDIMYFRDSNIGTVHTFQGKEASTVIICTSASKVREKSGGINWVNSKPNLLNVAVTRAKHHLFIIGNKRDWSEGLYSSELQSGNMVFYNGLEELKSKSVLKRKTCAVEFNINFIDGKIIS